MGSGLSMQARAEITGKYARVYTRASKKDKGRILDEVCAVTGWSRDNARRRLVAAAKRPPVTESRRGAGLVVLPWEVVNGAEVV